ncbi:gp229 [Sphingomonas phage PAU]|uniref:gp229 n=1 Tax=Sphingomonas phage PAU TaxID=1150991 RepID=UPI0002573383|nr:gp229 [Sphingomonas phage PAU]AFF28227.1 gp229 [Sphingomonas phage PAU]
MIITVFIILAVMITAVSFITINEEPSKVNKHGLKYKLEEFASTSYNLAFWDESKKKLIWILYVGIDVDNFNRNLVTYPPKLDRAFFEMGRKIDYAIDKFETIEQVYEYNKVRESEAIRANERYENRVKQFEEQRSKYE